MNFKQVSEKILHTKIKGQLYERKIVGRNFKLSFLERFKKFKNPDISFPNDYLFSIKRKNSVYDVYALPKHVIIKNLTLLITKDSMVLISEEDLDKINEGLKKVLSEIRDKEEAEYLEFEDEFYQLEDDLGDE